jgi:nitroimidazol reductase NimA-like FMN-containing flavoprotein (pyridoxamine 5'-phosphate oxidase superfamily)
MIIRELSSKECGEALNAATFGRLGCARDNQPYVVPVFFATDIPLLHSARWGSGLSVVGAHRASGRVC